MFKIPSEDFLHRALITNDWVDYTDCDMYGHLNTAAYVSKMVNHRCAILDRCLKVSLSDITNKDKVGMVFTDVKIKFMAPAFHEEELEFASWDDSIQPASFTIEFLISNKAKRKVLAAGKCKFVNIDLTTGRPKALQKEWISSADENLLLKCPTSEEYMKGLNFNPEVLKAI